MSSKTSANRAFDETSPIPAAGRQSNPVVPSAGVMAAALGVSVLAGFHIDNDRVVLDPTFPPSDYATALCFIALGTALLALHLGWRLRAQLAAGLAGLLCLAKLIESATGAPRLPGTQAMATQTAICLGLLSAAMLLMNGTRGFRHRPPLWHCWHRPVSRCASFPWRAT